MDNKADILTMLIPRIFLKKLKNNMAQFLLEVYKILAPLLICLDDFSDDFSKSLER